MAISETRKKVVTTAVKYNGSICYAGQA